MTIKAGRDMTGGGDGGKVCESLVNITGIIPLSNFILINDSEYCVVGHVCFEIHRASDGTKHMLLRRDAHRSSGSEHMCIHSLTPSSIHVKIRVQAMTLVSRPH